MDPNWLTEDADCLQSSQVDNVASSNISYKGKDNRYWDFV